MHGCPIGLNLNFGRTWSHLHPGLIHILGFISFPEPAPFEHPALPLDC